MSSRTRKPHTPAKKPVRARRPSRRRWPWLLVGAALVVGVVVFFSWRMERWSIREQALNLARAGQWAEAEPLLRQAADLFPEDVEIIRALAQAQAGTQKLLADAEPFVSRWCEMEPTNPEAFQMRMDLYLGLKQNDKALADGLRLLELKPQDTAIRAMVAQLLTKTGKFAEAEQMCKQMLAADPGNPNLKYLLAQVYYLRGDGDKADEVVDGLLKKTPTYTKAILLKGLRHCEQKEYARAVPLLRKVLADKTEEENHQQARYQLSQALAALGQNKEAGELLELVGDIENAERLLIDSRQQPDNPEIQISAAKALMKVGRKDEALERLHHVLAHNPGHPAANKILADHYDKLGNKDLAAKHRLLAGK